MFIRVQTGVLTTIQRDEPARILIRVKKLLLSLLKKHMHVLYNYT